MGKTSERLPEAIDFGQRLRDLRTGHEWTQERLAEHAGLHWTYVGSIERGERNVSLTNIVKLADALDVPVGKLFPGWPSPPG